MASTQFQTVAEAFYPSIHRAALVLTGNGWDAEDLAQETFLQAARSWRRFAWRSTAGTWLYAILLAQHRRLIRGRARGQRRWLGWLARRPAERHAAPPDGELAARDWCESLWGRVAELSEPQRHVLVLRYCEELSYAEIADVLACPLGTVRSRLHHAKAALEAKLSETTVHHPERPQAATERPCTMS